MNFDVEFEQEEDGRWIAEITYIVFNDKSINKISMHNFFPMKIV
jgi:hypothetical protein